mmetsp:Transcript_54630/g.127185  ORF Transcript_54630/g.127185 Transcript_54630/m.127185 type:complete len:226 (-) Transcript_54630:47-724(-)
MPRLSVMADEEQLEHEPCISNFRTGPSMATTAQSPPSLRKYGLSSSSTNSTFSKVKESFSLLTCAPSAKGDSKLSIGLFSWVCPAPPLVSSLSSSATSGSPDSSASNNCSSAQSSTSTTLTCVSAEKSRVRRLPVTATVRLPAETASTRPASASFRRAANGTTCRLALAVGPRTDCPGVEGLLQAPAVLGRPPEDNRPRALGSTNESRPFTLHATSGTIVSIINR